MALPKPGPISEKIIRGRSKTERELVSIIQNADKVQKEFLKVFADLQRKVADDIAKSGGAGQEARQIAQLLLDRMLILCFIQEKGWLDGKPDYLYSRFLECWNKDPNGHSYYSDVLYPLFACLFDRDIRMDTVGAVPFLGAGLFEEGDKQTKSFFAIENSTFKGIFDGLLERFDFTIAEEPRLDGEVAINPEMLGRIFESVTLQIERDPEKDLRKPTGSYYTPRLIVHFMCREALKEYLAARLSADDGPKSKVAREKVGALVALPPAYQLDEQQIAVLKGFFDKPAAKTLQQAILDCRVCDPAVGSGAFVVGMLHEMAAIVSRLDVILDGPQVLSQRNYRYNLKKRIIESCLHGVDIQGQAVRICELRLWLALAADYQIDPGRPFPQAIREVPALPNLLHRIMPGDSLMACLFDHESPDAAWREHFGEVFAERGGFDIVIGNPPYSAKIDRSNWDRICSLFPNSRSAKNSAAAFLALPKAIGSSGVIACQIVPKSLTYSNGWAETRSLVWNDFSLLCVADASRAFEDALLEQEVVVYSRKPLQREEVGSYASAGLTMVSRPPVPVAVMKSLDVICNHLTTVGRGLLQRLSEENPAMGKFVTVKRGKGWQSSLSASPTGNTVRAIRGAHIRQFRISSDLPSLEVSSEMSGALADVKQPKLVCQNILAHIRNPYDTLVVMCAVDRHGCAVLDTVNMIFPKPDCPYSLDFLCGLLNSSFARWFFYFVVYNRAVRTMHFDSPYVGKLPLPKEKSKQTAEIEAIACDLANSGHQKKYFLPGDDDSFDALDDVVCDLFELSDAERAEVLRLSR